MFAPRVAEPLTKAAEGSTSRLTSYRPTLLGHRLGHDPAEQALFLQRTIGNQATLRLLQQQASRSAVRAQAGTSRFRSIDPTQVGRKCAACEAEEEENGKTLQTEPAGLAGPDNRSLAQEATQPQLTAIQAARPFQTTVPTLQRQSDNDQSADPGSRQLSSAQINALSTFGISFDPSVYSDCPGPILALAVAAMGVTALGIDVVLLLAGPEGLEAALAKFLSKWLTNVLAAGALWLALKAFDTFVDAADFAITCLENHGHDQLLQRTALAKAKVARDFLKRKYESLLKEITS